MKKICIALIGLFILTAFQLVAHSNIQFENLGNKIIVHYESEKYQQREEHNDIYKMIALYSDTAKILIDNFNISIYSKQGKFLHSTNKSNCPLVLSNSCPLELLSSENWVEIVNHYVMRELKAYQIRIRTKIENDEEIAILDNIDFEIISIDKTDLPNGVSQAFLPIYKSFIDNFDTSYLYDLPIRKSKMLIISHQDLLNNPNPAIAEYLQDFIDWKSAKGISIVTADIETIGNTTTQIKNYIQNAYDTWEIPPDYLLLIGDVDDNYEIPSWYISTEHDVTDHPYTLLAGNDYFPEILVGRISIDNLIEFPTVLNKILDYEKRPCLDDPEWLTRALVVAGNYSTSPPTPTTPIKTSRWLREKLLNFGYTQVDTVFYPPTASGITEITAFINNHLGFVNYRGWGDANGWHWPEFQIPDVQALTNDSYLPVITSFVCNTGDFANSVDPCFGEAWLRLGTPMGPKGGVIFIGPSDLHTSTKYNNSICSGFYYGLLDENILGFGSAVLRGKLELYNNFPLNRESGDKVEFYFHVYNILGDPSLSMWTKIPEEINCDLPDEISIGTNYLELNLPNMDGGIVTARKDDEFHVNEIIESGQAILYITPQTEGDMEVVITKGNYTPFIDTINIVSEPTDVGLSNYNILGDGIVNPGDNITLEITLQNHGTQSVNSVSAELSTNNQFVNITTNSADFGTINPTATATANYQFELMSNCPDNEVLEFTLNISTGNISKFEIIVTGLAFEIDTVIVDDANGILDPGEQKEITVSIENIGSSDAVNLTGILTALTDAVNIIDSTGDFGNIVSSDIGQANFTVMAYEDCFVGRNAGFRIDLTDGNGLVSSVSFSLEIGEVDSTAPTGPDGYGYFAYDSNDTEYSECPTYQWYEIDPNQGGDGTVILMRDDVSHTIELPFDFTYYGVAHDTITICSNGWISFMPTWMTNFRNWSIPSALGAYAMAAPYWDDLQGEYNPADSSYADMRICYYYDMANSRFIIEWSDCFDHSGVFLEKFEIVLYDPAIYQTQDGNGEIQFNYHTINNPDATSNYATVGIENLDQSDGLLYTYANIYSASATPLDNELAIKFTTDPPDNYVGIDDNETVLATGIKLYQNYPNPFNPKTCIKYSLTKSANVCLKIYNIKGEFVKTLLDERQKAGYHNVIWDGNHYKNKAVSSGIYFYRLKVDDKVIDTRKCLLLK